MITFRQYQEGDEDAIIELFLLSYGHPISKEKWKWRFKDNPVGRTYINLAWDGDVLVGHYSIAPRHTYMFGDECLTALSTTTMVHPDYRGKDLFTTLAKQNYEKFSSDGGEMIYGFPNALSHGGFVRHLHWNHIYEIPTMMWTPPSYFKGKIPTNIERFVYVNELHDIWAGMKEQYPIIHDRSLKYLLWRYVNCPTERYVMASYKAEKPEGYIVYKIYNKVSYDIVDLIFLEDDVGIALVEFMIYEAIMNGKESINLWASINSNPHFYNKLLKLGFRNSTPITYFGAIGFSTKSLHGQLPKSWYITMGDSDVY